MMSKIIHVLLCLSLCILVGCASQRASVQRANDLVSCKNVCKQHLTICSQVCHNNCRECNQSVNRATAMYYNKYKNEQCVQGTMIVRDLNSYRDPLQCCKTTCDCQADYNVCADSCKHRH